MKLAIAGLAVALLMTAEQPTRIDISQGVMRQSVRGAADNFSGVAFIDTLIPARSETKATASQVTFTPGARTAWHSHPAGQTLYVTSGAGWVQEWHGEKRAIAPGDVVWTPPGVKHWHGANAVSVMSHVAIQESLYGKNVDWMEPVSDEQYDR